MASADVTETHAESLPDPGIMALCLSGGGFRATLFHLGVIRALRQSTLNGRMALEQVREIYAVSGGSILAAHFLLNYERYISPSDRTFDKVARELLDFAALDLRNRVLRRWPFWWLARADNPRGQLLQREYDRFLIGRPAALRGQTIGQCYADRGNLPTFHFLSTSFTTGALCSFSRDCFELLPPGEETPIVARADGLPLSFAVAASSAFPPMFPPILLTPEMLGTVGQPPFDTNIALSDGGVFDNYGIDKFCLARRKGPRPGILIVSGAGGSLATDPNERYYGIIPRSVRASDIMMRRVGDTTASAGKGVVGRGLVDVRIRTTLPASTISETTQNRLRMIRTDLDRFDGSVAAELVQHGERVTLHELGKHELVEGTKTFVLQPRASAAIGVGASSIYRTEELDTAMETAARRSYRELLFGSNDFLWIALWWLIAASVIGTLG